MKDYIAKKPASPAARVFKSADPEWPRWGATRHGWGEPTKWFWNKDEAEQYAGIKAEPANCEWQGKDVTTKRLIFTARKLAGWSKKEITR